MLVLGHLEWRCSDDVDEDCDGRTDCGDADCATACSAGGSCEGYQAIDCSTPGSAHTINSTTIDGPSRIDRYACDPWLETGREATYRVIPAVSGQLTAALSETEKDLDLIVLGAGVGGGCTADQTTCLAASSTAGDEVVSAIVQASTPYYVVVDGYNGDAGAFTLTVTCP